MNIASSRGGVAKLAAAIGSLLLLMAPHKAAAAGWTRVDFPSQFVSAVHVAPSNDDTVYALSSGDSSAVPKLLHVTLDGGATWQNRNLPAAPSEIAVDPKDDKTAYLASFGIYKTTDSGQSWVKLSEVFQSVFKLIAVAPSDSSTIYAETSNGLLVASHDAGTSWTFLGSKVFSNGLVLTIDPENAEKVWAGETGALWHSTDGGVSWSLSTSAQLHILGLAIDPVDPTVMYMTGNDHIWKSVDGGADWAEFGEGYYKDSIHTRQSGQIQISPGDHNSVYLADDGYYFKDEGGVWNSISSSSWSAVSGFSENVFSLAVSRSAVWVGARDGLYVNTDLVPAKKPAIRRPVLVIPGILGSWNFGLGWVLDPFLHTYDNLISALQDAGYKSNQTLFTFPYEWRDSIELNATRLASKIAEVKAETGASAVDVIAHSMGGLVLRQYVEGDNYAGDVGRVVFVAVPQRGAPAAYEGLEGGDIFFANGLLGELASAYFGAEAAGNGFPDVVSYVRQRVVSASELLPDYPYITELPGLFLRPLGDGYPANPLLPILNSAVRLNLFNSRVEDELSLIGDVGEGSTISGFQISQQPDPTRHLWPHGIPDGFPETGVVRDDGDLAVPASSASAFWQPRELQANHGAAVSAAADDAINFLTGATPPHFDAPIPEVTRMLIFQAHSPVRLEVTEPDGSVIKDPGPAAAGSYYTGEGEFQLVTIPNPKNGAYQIKIVGTGTGKYQIDEELAGDAMQPIKSSVTGYARPAAEADLGTTLNAGAASSLQAVDQTPPTTNLALDGVEGLNGWYVSPSVKISLSSSDGLSGVGRTEYQVDQDSEWREYTEPFSIGGGAHTLRFRSWDVAGNIEQIHAESIRVDAVPPQITLQVPASILREGAFVPELAVGDLGSGIGWQKLLLDGSPQTGAIMLTGLSLGGHTLELVASDVAGNISRSTASFRLVVDLPLLKADLQKLAAAEKIKNLGLQVSLMLALDDAGSRRRLRLYLRDLRRFCRRVQDAKVKEIELPAKGLLLEEANFLIGEAEQELAVRNAIK